MSKIGRYILEQQTKEENEENIVLPRKENSMKQKRSGCLGIIILTIILWTIFYIYVIG